MQDPHIKRVLISEQEIHSKLKEAAKQIDAEYAGKNPLLVSILKGSFVFLSDFCRALTIPCEISFMCTKCYFNGTTPLGEPEMIMDLDCDIKGRDVIIVEDIVDSGLTLNEITAHLKKRQPNSLKVITLLDKPSRRQVPFSADVSLFTIENYFVIGYGLDCAERYRNLPYIAEYQE